MTTIMITLQQVLHNRLPQRAVRNNLPEQEKDEYLLNFHRPAAEVLRDFIARVARLGKR